MERKSQTSHSHHWKISGMEETKFTQPLMEEKWKAKVKIHTAARGREETRIEREEKWKKIEEKWKKMEEKWKKR